MKGTSVNEFLKTNVLPHLPGLRLRGRLLYYTPAEHLLRGYLVETSAFVRGKFAVTEFVQVLAVPAANPTLSFGKRLGNGGDLWWTLVDGNEDSVAKDLVSRLRAEETGFFGPLRDLSGFVASYDRAPIERVDIRVAEALFYALVLLNRDTEALELVQNLRADPAAPKWRMQLFQRLSDDASELSLSRSKLLERIMSQERSTRQALGIDEPMRLPVSARVSR